MTYFVKRTSRHKTCDHAMLSSPVNTEQWGPVDNGRNHVRDRTLLDAVRRAQLGRLEQSADVAVFDVWLAVTDVASHPNASALATESLLLCAFANSAGN